MAVASLLSLLSPLPVTDALYHPPVLPNFSPYLNVTREPVASHVEQGLLALQWSVILLLPAIWSRECETQFSDFTLGSLQAETSPTRDIGPGDLLDADRRQAMLGHRSHR